MAGAEVIGAAIGVLLLILIGYLLVGSSLTVADIVTTAQKDVTLQNEARLNTAIEISDITIQNPVSPFNLKFNLKNSGNEVVGNFNHIDLFVTFSDAAPKHYSFISGGPGSDGSNTWGYTIISHDSIHPAMLDPNETMLVEIDGFTSLPLPFQITMITPNGAQATNAKLT